MTAGWTAKSTCVNSWAEVQVECKGCRTVKRLHMQVDELEQMGLMMTGQGEN